MQRMQIIFVHYMFSAYSFDISGSVYHHNYRRTNVRFVEVLKNVQTQGLLKRNAEIIFKCVFVSI